MAVDFPNLRPYGRGRPPFPHPGTPMTLRLALFALLLGLPGASPAQGPTWKAGVGRAVVTPETGVWLAGYGSKRPPDGKLHDLWVKALALEDPAGQRAVLITSDFQGVPKEMSDRVFADLLKRYQ